VNDQVSRTVFKDFNDRQTFEHDLINRKTTWLLTTQSILFTAYGVTFRTALTPEGLETFRRVLAISALAIALIMFFGVFALIGSKWRSWKTYRAWFARKDTPNLPEPFGPDDELQWGVETRNTKLALAPEVVLPLVFIAAWLSLLLS
jgi:hypothetical protein